MPRTQYSTDELFSDLEFDIGDDVAIRPGAIMGGHTGTVVNRKKLITVYQYLVKLDGAGRVWFDAGDVVAPDELDD